MEVKYGVSAALLVHVLLYTVQYGTFITLSVAPLACATFVGYVCARFGPHDVLYQTTI